MKNLYYTDLAMQDYFKIEGISTKEAQNVFKWRVRMAPLGKNFRGKEKFKMCPLCLLHLDNQTMIFKCESLKNRMKIECEIEDLYSNNVTVETAITITKRNVRQQFPTSRQTYTGLYLEPEKLAC